MILKFPASENMKKKYLKDKKKKKRMGEGLKKKKVFFPIIVE